MKERAEISNQLRAATTENRHLALEQWHANNATRLQAMRDAAAQLSKWTSQSKPASELKRDLLISARTVPCCLLPLLALAGFAHAQNQTINGDLTVTDGFKTGTTGTGGTGGGNAWFDIEYKAESVHDYDPDNNTILVYGTPDYDNLSSAYIDPNADINIILIGRINYYQAANPIYGTADPGLNQVIVNTGGISGGFPYVFPDGVVKDSIGHEIGHVMIGAGHPDETGPRPCRGPT